MGGRRVRFTCLVLVLVAAGGCSGGGASGGGGGGGGEVTPPPPAVATVGDAIRGGQLYDKWWKVSGVQTATEPTETNVHYSYSGGKQTGSTTWRCKECHGWDYRGAAGAYRSGSHYTGSPGLLHAQDHSAEELLSEIRDGVAGSAMRGFGEVLSEQDLADLVAFVKEGLVDLTVHLDPATGAPLRADPAKGQQLFASTCAACHGADGRALNFGSVAEPEFVGSIAADNPWEFQHKVRFGQPGSPMPSSLRSGGTVQDVMDLLGYARTLPTASPPGQ